MRFVPVDLTQKNTKNVQGESEKEDLLSVSNKKAKRNTHSGPHSCDGFSRTSFMDRAQEVQANLVSGVPSFVKTLTKSQISGRCRLDIPAQFCKVHMPKEDTTIVLLDENEKVYNTNYTASKRGLSSGWKSFCIANKLVEGDVIGFQLIEPFKFKVYIVRAFENFNCHAEDQNNVIMDIKWQKCTDSPVVNTHTVDDSLLSDDDNCGSEIMEGIQLSNSIINFRDVKSFGNFNSHEESEKEDMLSTGNKKTKVNTNSGPHSCDGVSTTSVMERAQEVQANLVSRAPSFIKTLSKSHVSGKFKLNLPTPFVRVHMPKVDATIVLLDENEKVYNTKYPIAKPVLSGGGWRHFSIVNKLEEGDAIVFQLIEPFKFKVYIVRALENLNQHQVRPIDADQNSVIVDKRRQKCTESPAINTYKVEDSLLSDDDNCGSKNMEGIQLSKPIINFKDVKSFQDFNTHVNGLILNSDQISINLREKYFKLCWSQNMFLHENLTEVSNSVFATGIISGTINIADAIRDAKSTTPLNHLESWDKTLKAFEDLGMVVGFLRTRINTLINIRNTAHAKTNERDDLLKLVKGLDAEIKEHDTLFEEVSSASW